MGVWLKKSFFEQQNRCSEWVESDHISFHRKYYLFFVEDFPVETAFHFDDIRYLQIHDIFESDQTRFTVRGAVNELFLGNQNTIQFLTC